VKELQISAAGLQHFGRIVGNPDITRKLDYFRLIESTWGPPRGRIWSLAKPGSAVSGSRELGMAEGAGGFFLPPGNIFSTR